MASKFREAMDTLTGRFRSGASRFKTAASIQMHHTLTAICSAPTDSQPAASTLRHRPFHLSRNRRRQTPQIEQRGIRALQTFEARAQALQRIDNFIDTL